jgi:uncharacterized protein YciI
MSTSAPARKYEWLVVIPDKPGALAKRLEVRPQHFAALKTNIENGCFQMGGMYLVPPATPIPLPFRIHVSTRRASTPVKPLTLTLLTGAILDEVPVDDEPSSMKMSGSTIVMVASSRDEVVNLLREDVYAKNGVWDVDNVQMWPLKCAFRIPVKGQQV